MFCVRSHGVKTDKETHTTMKKRLTPILFCALCYSTGASAIVSMEGLHTSKPKEGFSGSVDLSLGYTSGNTEKEDYSLGSRVQWHKGAMTDFLLLSYSFGKVNGEKNTDKGFAHLRHIQQFRPRLAWEAYLQTEKDEFSRLEYRGLAGGGLRFTVYERENVGGAFLGIGGYYSEERIDSSHPDGGTETLWRGSSYLLLKYQLSPNSVLGSTTYYQPSAEGADDYRLLEEAALQVKLTDRLSLVVSMNYRFDSDPPQGVEKRDVTYNTSFSFEF